ncbi:vegetative cell wall protein gp1-like [Setaria italica]|uniref:vegetative cell wall protein gp1-like n=1 Tax=Setaria italica TaxID=4555 RepID=UPI000350F79E|nr:vegetative cell wall protein gp1-like [Setaria italica]
MPAGRLHRHAHRLATALGSALAARPPLPRRMTPAPEIHAAWPPPSCRMPLPTPPAPPPPTLSAPPAPPMLLRLLRPLRCSTSMPAVPLSLYPLHWRRSTCARCVARFASAPPAAASSPITPGF